MMDWLEHLLDLRGPGLVLALAFVVIVVYPTYDYFMVRHHLRRVGSEYCRENGYTFIGIGHAKSHFSVIYKATDGGRRPPSLFFANHLDGFEGSSGCGNSISQLAA
jgi:hypothetical protein